MLVTVMCLLVYLVLAVAVFWPALPWSTTTLPAGSYGRGLGDPAQMTWFLEWVPYALRHGLNLFHTNFLDYPNGVDLANGTSVPFLALLATPVTLTLGPVAAFNLLLRLAFASSAGSMFVVLRTWCRWPAAFIGGLLYGFGPYMISQGQNHLNLAFVPLPPLIVGCFYELLVTRRRPPVRMGLLVGALAGAQALINPELLALLAVVVAIGMIGLAIYARNDIREQFKPLVRAVAPATFIFLIITGYMLWSMLFASGHLVGPVYPVKALQSYRADLLGPIVPTTDQFIAPLSLAVLAFKFVGGNFTENSGYLSLPLVILIAVFAIVWRRDRVILVSALLALVAFILSLGSRLEIGGRVTGIPMPEAILTHLPLLDSTVPARFSLVVSLFAVIAVAVGGERFLRSIATRRSKPWTTQFGEISGVLAMVTSALLIFPLVPLATQSPPWSRDTVSTLNAIPSGSVVLTYPFTIEPWTEAMSWQAADDMRFRLIGGYVTAQENPHYGNSFPPLLNPPIVQEYLTAAQFGESAISGEEVFYPVPNPTINVQAALCSFLTNYKVNAVLFWKGGPYGGVDPSKVRHLFYSALGKPTLTNSNGTVIVWLTKSSHCSS